MYWSAIAAALLLLARVESRDSATLLRRADAFVDPRTNGGSMLDNGLFSAFYQDIAI